ncbi:MAG: hypothetical protein CSA42_07835 [Gammaproteobacteria bacterium]|nr:MAG: hypothetical protein CSA42_07835 [Gammaproteobacteria bacterium]
MKTPDREIIFRLENLPNVGKAIAERLRLIDIDHPEKLIGKNPLELYHQLCIATEKRHDPCVIDTFMSIVHFMKTGEALPWWAFTDERKKILNKEKAVLIITHHQELIRNIVPDYVHVMIDGSIVKTGGADLVAKIEGKGFNWIREEVK